MEVIRISCEHKLIVTIIKKGYATKIVQATKKAGCKGGTILLGRGTANKCGYLRFLQIDDCDQKEVILTLVDESKVDIILDTIAKVGKLNKPGTGIAFVINTKCITGICHMMLKTLQESETTATN